MQNGHSLIRKKFILIITSLMLAGSAGTAMAEADKYRLVWNHDPATTMTIGWGQDSAVTHYLRYGNTPEVTDWAREDVTAITDFVNHRNGIPNTITSYFVDLKNLTPDSSYYFQVCEEILPITTPTAGCPSGEIC